MRNDKENIIVTLTFDFSLKIIEFSEEIRKINRYEMAPQIFRSGTSIGANMRSTKCREQSRFYS